MKTLITGVYILFLSSTVFAGGSTLKTVNSELAEKVATNSQSYETAFTALEGANQKLQTHQAKGAFESLDPLAQAERNNLVNTRNSKFVDTENAQKKIQDDIDAFTPKQEEAAKADKNTLYKNVAIGGTVGVVTVGGIAWWLHNKKKEAAKANEKQAPPSGSSSGSCFNLLTSASCKAGEPNCINAKGQSCGSPSDSSGLGAGVGASNCFDLNTLKDCYAGQPNCYNYKEQPCTPQDNPNHVGGSGYGGNNNVQLGTGDYAGLTADQAWAKYNAAMGTGGNGGSSLNSGATTGTGDYAGLTVEQAWAKYNAAMGTGGNGGSNLNSGATTGTGDYAGMTPAQAWQVYNSYIASTGGKPASGY